MSVLHPDSFIFILQVQTVEREILKHESSWVKVPLE